MAKALLWGVACTGRRKIVERVGLDALGVRAWEACSQEWNSKELTGPQLVEHVG